MTPYTARSLVRPGDRLAASFLGCIGLLAVFAIGWAAGTGEPTKADLEGQTYGSSRTAAHVRDALCAPEVVHDGDFYSRGPVRTPE